MGLYMNLLAVKLLLLRTLVLLRMEGEFLLSRRRFGARCSARWELTRKLPDDRS